MINKKNNTSCEKAADLCSKASDSTSVCMRWPVSPAWRNIVWPPLTQQQSDFAPLDWPCFEHRLSLSAWPFTSSFTCSRSPSQLNQLSTLSHLWHLIHVRQGFMRQKHCHLVLHENENKIKTNWFIYKNRLKYKLCNCSIDN